MKKGYIAGKLFSDAEIRQRKHEGRLLRENTNINWYNPIEAPCNDKAKLPTAQDIFEGDTAKVIQSDYIIAELDGEDSGTATEIGICYGVNFVLESLAHLIIEEGLEANEAVAVILESIPLKKVYGHLSDIRVSTAGEYEGRYVPFGINQYFLSTVEQMGKVFTHFEDIVEQIKKDEENN